jgi:hypothetical protein
MSKGVTAKVRYILSKEELQRLESRKFPGQRIKVKNLPSFLKSLSTPIDLEDAVILEVM